MAQRWLWHVCCYFLGVGVCWGFFLSNVNCWATQHGTSQLFLNYWIKKWHHFQRWNKSNKEGEVHICTMQFKDWVVHGPVPHNFRDHFSFRSAVVAVTGGEVSQSWEAHELLRTELSLWTGIDAHWCKR